MSSVLGDRLKAGVAGSTTVEPEEARGAEAIEPADIMEDSDPEGTIYYKAKLGAFNTICENGEPINFVAGVFKTSEQHCIDYLENFCGAGGPVEKVTPEESPIAKMPVETDPPPEGGEGTTAATDEPPA